MNNEVIITCAVTGAGDTVGRHPGVPVTPQQVADAAIEARIAAVDAMVLASDEAIQIHGGFGYTVEYHVERHYRDAKTLEVLDGGNGQLRDRLASMQFS